MKIANSEPSDDSRMAVPLKEPAIMNQSAPTLPVTFNMLIVDDSIMNRKMLQRCLSAGGHTCTVAVDGAEALAIVMEKTSNGSQGQPFDVILMDFEMPNMDGPTATKEIRSLGYTAPIFGVTGNGSPSDVQHFLSSGANKVILKPFRISVFGEAMNAIINQHSEA